MKPSDEQASCDIQLASETLAVAFSECSRRKSIEDERRGSVATNNRGGKSLFRKFIKENSASVWKPELVKSLSTVRFSGYLHEPPTLLLQGDSTKLQHIRDAWSNRLLRPPPGYHIDFVGDVTRIGARPLTRGRFVPLCDAICISIGNVTSRNEIASQEVILEEIEKSFPGVHSPTRGLLHETLGKLIRNRKVFCTGPGYYLVTTKTYSGKVNSKSEMNQSNDEDRKAHGCEACLQNRVAFEDQVRERRSYRVRKSREEPAPAMNTTVDNETLHGSVVTNNVEVQNKTNQEKRPSPKKSVERDRRSSIVGKVADKLFRRRRKSSTDRKISELTNTPSPKHNDGNEQVRDLTEEDARRLGYKTSNHQRSARTNSHGDRSSSESPVKRHHSPDIRVKGKHTPEVTQQPHTLKYFEQDNRIRSPERRVAPDLIPETHRSWKNGIRRSHSERKSVQTNSPESNPEKQPKPDMIRSISGNTRFPKLRDVAVSCNLEDENDADEYMNRRVMTSPVRNMTSPTRDARGKLLKRSKSLRLPREQSSLEYDGSTSQVFIPEQVKRYPPPEYNSLRKSDTNHGMTYDSLQRSMDERQMRRSVSSTSTGKDYSYLHACHFAPSVRVGSVIADHLEELDRRRQYLVHKSSHEMSPSPSITSSGVSCKSNETPPGFEETSPEHIMMPSQNHIMTSPPRQDPTEDSGNVVEEEVEPKETEESLDPETQAALEVAKRLAKFDIRMTREEWKEYFAEKILPPQVEKALREASENDSESQQGSSPTWFENASGSVETVIDVQQRENTKSRRSRTSDASNKSSSSSSDKIAKPRKKSEYHDPRQLNGTDEYSSLRSADSSRMNDTNNNWGQNENVDKLTGHKEFPVLYKCPDFNSDEDYEPQVFYTCDLGHRHLPYCEQHMQLTTMDSASLTEDSGFHSARERSSLSSWDNRKKPRGTFV